MKNDVDLLGLPNDVALADGRTRVAGAPNGWEPGIRWDTPDQGEITSPAVTEKLADPDKGWTGILKKLGLDENVFAVVPPVEIKYDPAAWHRDNQGEDAVTRPVWRYKARVVRIGSKEDPNFEANDMEDLVDYIGKWKRPKREAPSGEYCMWVDLADWQVGKADGRGTKKIIENVLQMIAAVDHRITALRKMGYRIGRLHVQGLGDLLEGCLNHYAMQCWSVELDRREQIRVVRRLLTEAIITWAKRVEWLTVGCVPGNHGEHRDSASGKAFTTFGDNDDVAVFEQVAEAVRMNPELEHVEFTIPDQNLIQVFDLAGTISAFIHAHQATGRKQRQAGRSLPPAQAKVLSWWESQAFQMSHRGLADAHVLHSGHYHHFSAIEHGASRLHLQCPPMDDGSIWFENMTGITSNPGTLTGLAYGGSTEALEIV